METLFIRILETSCYATVVGAALLLIQRLFRGRIGATWQYALWFVLLARLAVPFAPQSAMSLFNLVPIEQPVRQAQTYWASQTAHAPEWDATGDPEEHEAAARGATASEDARTPTLPQRDAPGRPLSVLAAIWILGASALLIWQTGVHVAFRLRLRKRSKPASPSVQEQLDRCRARLGMRRRVRVVVQDAISMPALHGILAPRILLTAGIADGDAETLDCVLTHELAHVRRQDVAVTSLLAVLRAVHWFNPAIGFLFARIRRDMEAATDERAIRAMGMGMARAYAHSLLDVLQTTVRAAPRLGVLGILDDRRGVERRIRSIQRVERSAARRRAAAITSVAAIALCALFLLTNAIGAQPAARANADFQYAPLADIAEHRTAYVGDNSAVGAIVSLLPPIYNGRMQRFLSLQTEAQPYGLTLYYEAVDVPYEGSMRTMRTIAGELNALILFAFIDNLDTVTYARRDTPSDGTLQAQTYTVDEDDIYHRTDLEVKYGSPRALADDLPRFQELLLDHWRIDGERAHFNRVRIGATAEYVRTRDSEPSDRYGLADGCERWAYRAYGRTEWTGEDGSTATAMKGSDLWIDLAPQEGGDMAVIQMRMFGGDADNSEILDDLGIQQGTFDEVLYRLGEAPTWMGRKALDASFRLMDAQVASYWNGLRANEGLAAVPSGLNAKRPAWLFVPVQGDALLYFHFQDGLLDEHGVTINESTALQRLWSPETDADSVLRAAASPYGRLLIEA